MKKILVAIILFTYAFASSGASVDLHYCMGELIGLDFDHASKSQCSNCGMPVNDNKGCCENKQIQVKIDKDQLIKNNHLILSHDFTAVIPDYFLANNILYGSATIINTLIHGPPLISCAPLYLFDCSLRI